MADIDSSVAEAGRRARSYWEMDGFTTLLLSAALLLSGIFHVSIKDELPFWQRLIPGLGLLPVLYLLLSRRSPVIRWLKATFTYPRTGYVNVPVSGPAAQLQRQEDWTRHPDLLVMILSVFLFDFPPYPWIGLIALAAGVGFLCGKTQWRKSEFGWFLISGFALSGVIVASLPIRHPDGLGYLAIAFGILYFLKGAMELFRFLRRHPVPPATEGSHG